MNKLPNELKYIIYKYCDNKTKIKLHSIFKWSYKIGCPLNFKPFNPKQVFKIPNNLEGDITNIHITCNPYVFYKYHQIGFFFGKYCYNYPIYNILESYNFFINNRKIQETNFLISRPYYSKHCKYDLSFYFNDELPLPSANNTIGCEYKIELNFYTYVSNLQIHITTTTQEYTFNLN